MTRKIVGSVLCLLGALFAVWFFISLFDSSDPASHEKEYQRSFYISYYIPRLLLVVVSFFLLYFGIRMWKRSVSS
jgi:hypothetical protein